MRTGVGLAIQSRPYLNRHLSNFLVRARSALSKSTRRRLRTLPEHTKSLREFPGISQLLPFPLCCIALPTEDSVDALALPCSSGLWTTRKRSNKRTPDYLPSSSSKNNKKSREYKAQIYPSYRHLSRSFRLGPVRMTLQDRAIWEAAEHGLL